MDYTFGGGEERKQGVLKFRGDSKGRVLAVKGLWGLAIYLALKTERTEKAWRKLLIINACLSFALPLAGFITTVKASHQFASQGKNMEATIMVGAGSLASIIMGVFGFFLGAIFLTIGLLVGRDKKGDQ